MTEVKDLSYAKISKLGFKVAGGEIYLEIPHKILEEVDWLPKPGDKVEILISKEYKSDDSWEIVYSGKVYLKKEDSVFISFGGLIGVIKVKRYLSLEVGDKVYMGLKRVS
ncbi:MAG TPA: hypothetical protein ENF80_03600 [Thermofilum sp.]|nr:hypothetical protein [Thermofilum sp.]